MNNEQLTNKYTIKILKILASDYGIGGKISMDIPIAGKIDDKLKQILTEQCREILQIVVEDVPHQHQGRLVKKLNTKQR